MTREQGRERGREPGRGAGRPRTRRSAPAGATGYGAAFAPRRPARERTPLSIKAIVGAAVDILDRDGGDALTFRRLAQELGVGVASLYWHVESKDVLLDLALDHVLGEIDLGGRSRPKDWQQDLHRTGVALYRLFLTHRWAGAQVILSSDRGPNMLTLWEYVARRLHDAGFSLQQGLDAVGLLLNHVVSSAVQESVWDETGTLSAVERRKRMRARGDVLRSLDPQRFPTIVASADIFERHDQAKQFEDGLDLILAGIAQQLPG